MKNKYKLKGVQIENRVSVEGGTEKSFLIELRDYIVLATHWEGPWNEFDLNEIVFFEEIPTNNLLLFEARFYVLNGEDKK